ncbi:TonB family protein [Acinetobacter sp. NIPH 2699]|uniref:TonB family protein n=1 Tax=Acinetobacter sp. NIPH 2699 TaxID=2923433 RepID=UPI001F4A1D59|nr:TonB family protein [Acinetobacter sp. NIPH 2699]MCH7336379.1 TonB family protein [Acinetobacter sp. NIPH 2699]
MKLKNLSPHYREQFKISTGLTLDHFGKWGVVFAVMVLHLIGLWFLSHLIEPYTLANSPKVNALKVHFISVSSSEQPTPYPPEKRTVATSPKEQGLDKQPVLNTSSAQQKATEQTQILSSRNADRVIQDSQLSKRTHNEPATPSKASVLPSLNEDKTTPNQTVEQQLERLNQSQTPYKQQQGESQLTSGGIKTSASQQELSRSPDSRIDNDEPVQVSSVDVLSFGQLRYDDRELKQQNRVVELRIRINENGQPTDIQLRQSSGIASLDERVIQAARKSKFKPYKINGRAVAVVVEFPVQLTLSRNR